MRKTWSKWQEDGNNIKTLNGDQEVASTVISGLKVASDMEGVR